MLSVTSSAKEKLKEALDNERTDADTFIRIAPSSTTPAGIGFILDYKEMDDKGMQFTITEIQ